MSTSNLGCRDTVLYVLQVALLVIAVAELVGIAVLFTEFSVKFQKVTTSAVVSPQ